MPGFDGTGPRGKGPLTGRGLGRCFRNIYSSRKMKMMSLAVPVVAAIVNDIRKPDGITRKLYGNLKSSILGKSREELPKLQSMVQKALQRTVKIDKE